MCNDVIALLSMVFLLCSTNLKPLQQQNQHFHELFCPCGNKKTAAVLVFEKATNTNTISFIEDDKNKGREVSADTAATETYYMMGINPLVPKVVKLTKLSYTFNNLNNWVQ